MAAGGSFNRDDNFQAAISFAAATPLLKQNQYGGNIGGPIRRNKLFVFGYYEGFNNRQGSTSTLTVLSSAQRGGDFSGSAALRDPLNNMRLSRAMSFNPTGSIPLRPTF